MQTQTFTPSPKPIPMVTDKSTVNMLEKWSWIVGQNLFLDTYFFESPYKSGFAKEFLKQLFAMYFKSGGDLTVEFERVPCTETRMEMFKTLYVKGVVNEETLCIKKCPDVFLDSDITVSDCLRRLFMCSDMEDQSQFIYDESYDEMNECFSEEQQTQYLYLIMKHLSIGGGALCQYEDSFEPYFDLTKQLYKYMVSVQRIHNETNYIVTSDIFRIKSVTRDNMNLLYGGRNHPYNYCYVAVDIPAQKVTIWRSIFTTI